MGCASVTQAKIIIYTKKYCSYCSAAKELFKSKGVSFEEIDVTGDQKKLDEVIKKTQHQTIPQIFVGEKFVGGFRELEALDESGELNQILGI